MHSKIAKIKFKLFTYRMKWSVVHNFQDTVLNILQHHITLNKLHTSSNVMFRAYLTCTNVSTRDLLRTNDNFCLCSFVITNINDANRRHIATSCKILRSLCPLLRTSAALIIVRSRGMPYRCSCRCRAAATWFLPSNTVKNFTSVPATICQLCNSYIITGILNPDV